MARVLLIDDDGVVRETLRMVVEEAGFEVILAEGGADGLRAFRAAAPEMVLCDWDMPGVSGLEVLREIHASSPATPVIILTGHDHVSTAVQAMREGAYSYVLKGGSEALLMHELHEGLGYRQMRVRNAELEASNRNYQTKLEEMVAEKIAEIARLEQLKARAEKMAALGTVAAGVAHEINNPLAVIISSLNWFQESIACSLTELQAILRDGGKDQSSKALEVQQFYNRGFAQDAEELSSVLKEATESGARIVRIVTSIKRLSHSADDQKSGELAVALRQVQALCRSELEGKADLQIAVDPRVERVAMGIDDLVTVLSNLVNNAAQAMGPRGQIALQVRRTASDAVEISVVDNGEGISPEHLSKVCDPFFTTRRPGKGTGLGLFLVHQLMQSVGGQLEIESRVGVGTTVRLKLPALLSGEAHAEQKSC